MGWRDTVQEAKAPSWRDTVKEEGGGISDMAQSAIEGIGKSGTFGYLPQIQAGVAQGVDYLANKMDPNYPTEDYVTSRDRFIDRSKKLEEAAPGSMLAGEVVGALGTPMPGTGLIKGSGLGAKIGRAGINGLLQGAAYNPGDTKGEIDPLQLGDRAGNALASGGLSAGVQSLGLLGKLPGAASKASGLLRKLAEKPDLVPVLSGSGVGAVYLGSKAIKGDLSAKDLYDAALYGTGTGLFNKYAPKLAPKILNKGADLLEKGANYFGPKVNFKDMANVLKTNPVKKTLGSAAVKALSELPPGRVADMISRGLLPAVRGE